MNARVLHPPYEKDVLVVIALTKVWSVNVGAGVPCLPMLTDVDRC